MVDAPEHGGRGGVESRGREGGTRWLVPSIRDAANIEALLLGFVCAISYW